MSVEFSKKFIDAIEPTAKRLTFTSKSVSGLRLIVHPSGKKVWSWQGRSGGKPTTLTLGPYPAFSIREATLWACELIDQRDRGDEIHPGRKRAAEEAAIREAEEREAALRAAEELAASRNCDWLFDLYMRYEGGKRVTARERQQTYDREIKPRIGSKIVEQVTYNDLAAIIRDKAGEYPSASNHLQALIRRWFRWSVTIGRSITGLTEDPAKDLVKLAPIGSRARFLSDYEIGVLFRALDSCETPINGPVKVLLYMGHRRSEVINATWDEFNFEKGTWLVPSERVKTRQEHLLGMPQPMIDLFREQYKISGDQPFVWPAPWSGRGLEPCKPLNAFSKAVNKLNKKMKEIAQGEGRNIAPWTLHDLRRTLVTGMHSLLGPDDVPLIHFDVIERVVNHKIGGVRGTYNRHSYFAQKKAALRIWAEHLEAIRAKVVPPRVKRKRLADAGEWLDDGEGEACLKR